MATAPDSICFYCGQAFSLQTQNRVAGGKPCPVCAERLLEALPPLIPGPRSRRVKAGADPDQVGEPGSTWGTSSGAADFPEPA